VLDLMKKQKRRKGSEGTAVGICGTLGTSRNKLKKRQELNKRRHRNECPITRKGKLEAYHWVEPLKNRGRKKAGEPLTRGFLYFVVGLG